MMAVEHSHGPERWRKSPSTGESAEQTVPTIACGTPDVSGVFVVTMLVCFFILHARLRMRCASGVPRALNLEGEEGKEFRRARAFKQQG